MQLWKLGCRWGTKTPFFYDFVCQNNIVIGWVTKDYKIGDWLLITNGYTVLSLAEVTSKRDCILNHPELKEQCDDLEIPYDKDLFIYKAKYLHLKEDDQFNYPLQQGIVMVHGLEYVETFKKLRSMYLQQQTSEEIISLLKYKKQIILQGPPGTGKTKLAKELAFEITKTTSKPEIDDDTISSLLKIATKITTVAGNAEYEIINIDDLKKTVTLKKLSEAEATTTFTKIKEFWKDSLWKTAVSNNDDRRAAAIAGYLYENIKDKLNNKEVEEQIKVIQFHPSYSYEDFVRGIVAKPNEEGGGVLYESENKVLAEFAERANENYKAGKLLSVTAVEPDFKLQMELFAEKVNDAIDKGGDFKIGNDTTAKIVGITDGAFVYSFEKRKDIKYKLLFSDLIKINNSPQKISRTIDIRDMAKGYLKMIGKHPYYFKVYNLIKAILIQKNDQKPTSVVSKKYVLIIDEINRANLSSVLGELIYALEYRNEAVEGMYAIDGDNKMVLPPNLYIIGTMNTADRSVGHIDYAIRRRFAFVDVMPKDLSLEPGVAFHKILFDSVAALFNTNLSQEFEKKDVQLGHSYFIDKTAEGGSMPVRLEYEIKPILREYVKDGILIGETIKDDIENLQA